MAFDGIQITNRGRNLLAKAEAGQTKITYTRFSAGDGKLSGQMPVALKALINEKISFPVSRLKIQNENVVVPGFEFSNQGVSSGFFFREVGLWATDPDLGEILYAYANSGEGAEYIDAQNTSAVLKKLFNFELTVSNTAQVTVVVDDTIIYATPQDVADALKKSKDYTDAAILGVKVPDASTTQKGIVQLTNSTNSTSEVLAPTAKALKTTYDLASLAYRNRGDVPTDWNTATLEGAYNVARSSWDGYSNYPPGAYTYGKLIVFYGSGACVQLYCTHDDPAKIYSRTCFVGDYWRTWTEVFMTRGGKITGATAVDVGSGNNITKPTGNWALKVLNSTDNATEGGLVVGNRYEDASSTVFLAGSLNNGGTGAPFKEFFKVTGNGDVRFRDTDGTMVSLRDLKQLSVDKFIKIANAINGKGGSANASMTGDEFASAIMNMPVKRWASGTFNGQSATAANTTTGASMNVGVNNMTFLPKRVFIRLRLKDTYNNLYIEGYATSTIPVEGDTSMYGRFNNRISISDFTQQSGGFTCLIGSSRIQDYAGAASTAVIEAFQWYAYE